METPVSVTSRPASSPSLSAATSATSMEETATSASHSSAPSINEKQDNSSKLKTLVSILRKFVGVSDIANVRFSLPAQLLEPTPNLEYWNYLDRPDTFAAISEASTELGRFFAVLRFWFTKDLKYVKGRPCKPYNSTLGEFFRCIWTVTPDLPPVLDQLDKPIPPSHASTPTQSAHNTNKPLRLAFLTEQTSHHPPISAFYIACPERGITARGFDQISAKFTGTSIKVSPGAHNLGIFIDLPGRGEEYQLTHPIAHLGGFLKGTLNISVADTCYITCPKSRLKAILHYLDDSWIGKAQHRVEGVVFRYDPKNDTTTRIKDVAQQDVLARIDGSWQEQVYYMLNGSERTLLVDLPSLDLTPKTVPIVTNQLPNESRRVWADVTEAILAKEYSKATTLKNEVEDRQRARAKEREASGDSWTPRFFGQASSPSGRPELTPDGSEAVRKMLEGDWSLVESTVYGA